ncbi:hypothetical protein V3C99_014449, partial [Haemonchus contortus]
VAQERDEADPRKKRAGKGHSCRSSKQENRTSSLEMIIDGQYCTFFVTFSRGEIHFDEAPRRGRPSSTKTGIVLASVQSNPSQSLRGMERMTSAPRSTIHDSYADVAFVQHFLKLSPTP